MSERLFAMMARMRYIGRWGLMRNTFQENIQEHSHQVAVLAHALAVIQNRFFGGAVDPGAVAVAALYHDAGEILTGDLPTPIKYANPAIRDSYKQVEAAAEEKLLSMLPDELRADFEPVITMPDGEIRRLVKAADKLSAYLKCVEEVKAGNSEFRLAREQTWQALTREPFPALQYFIDRFLPSFELTLDELNGGN